MLILLGIFLSAAHNAQLHPQIRTHGSCAEVLSFDPNGEGLSVQSLNQVGRCDVYGISSVWFKDLKLVRIWRWELSNVLNFQNADPPPRFPPRKEERAPQHPGELLELLWWGSFWPVAGHSSARLVRESRRSWGFAFVFPSCCLGKTVPALALSDLWPWGAHLQSPGSRTESLYSWGAENTGGVCWPPNRPFCSLPHQTPAPWCYSLKSVSSQLYLSWQGLAFAVGNEWPWSFVTLHSTTPYCKI